VDGVAGFGVTTIEVQTGERIIRGPIASPTGAWVIGVAGDAPAKWMALDASENVVASGDIELMADGMSKRLPDWQRLVIYLRGNSPKQRSLRSCPGRQTEAA
jgi:hypothetical protein